MFDTTNTMELLDNTKSPRFIKCHLPAPLMPKEIWTIKPKIIYATRNLKDTAISYYHYFKNVHFYRGSLQDLLDLFMNDTCIYAPYHSHVSDFWNMRNEENILFLTYEEMTKNLRDVIQRTTQFLASKPLNDEQINKLADHLSFDKMSSKF